MAQRSRHAGANVAAFRVVCSAPLVSVYATLYPSVPRVIRGCLGREIVLRCAGSGPAHSGRDEGESAIMLSNPLSPRRRPDACAAQKPHQVRCLMGYPVPAPSPFRPTSLYI